MWMSIVATLLAGVAAGLLAYAAREEFGRLLDLVEADLRAKLRRMRIASQNLRRYMHFWLAIAGAVMAGFVIFANSWLFGVSAAVFLICLPWYQIRRWAQQRHDQIEDQLADAMVALSNAIKAGLSLAQALEILAQQSPKPIREEFQQMIGEYQLGKPLERCLAETKQRLESENFALFAAAMEASRESGGRLNETVERIATSVHELQRLDRKIQSETAQARASAVYMAMAPPVILLLYYLVIDPVNTERLFTTFLGQLMVCTAILLDVVAYLWSRRILNPDI